MYAFYDHEAAHAYRFKLEPGDAELVLDPTPILRWTNPLEEGSIHGVHGIATPAAGRTALTPGTWSRCRTDDQSVWFIPAGRP